LRIVRRYTAPAATLVGLFFFYKTSFGDAGTITPANAAAVAAAFPHDAQLYPAPSKVRRRHGGGSGGGADRRARARQIRFGFHTPSSDRDGSVLRTADTA
jgi:hypothetical protein